MRVGDWHWGCGGGIGRWLVGGGIGRDLGGIDWEGSTGRDEGEGGLGVLCLAWRLGVGVYSTVWVAAGRSGVDGIFQLHRTGGWRGSERVMRVGVIVTVL